LLPTVQTADVNMDRFTTEGAKKRHEDGKFQTSLAIQAKVGLLPTPQTQGLKECDQTGKTKFMDLKLLPTPRANKVNGCDLNSENLATRNKGNLEEVVAGWVTRMLPTPDCSDRQSAKSKQQGLSNVVAGSASQLNPQFVAEMMGFLPNHTELPFQKKETTWTEV